MKQIVILALLVLVSCKGEEKEQNNQSTLTVFDLDDLHPTVDKLKLSDIAENIEYIPLETRDDCMMDKITAVKFTDEYIFVRRVGEVYQFDHQGNFIRELYRIGKGPGECYGRNFAIDTDNSLVFVFDNYKYKYNIYNFDGRFITSFNDPSPDKNTGSYYIIHNNQLIFEVSDYYPPQYSFMSYGLEEKEIIYKHVNKEYEDLRMKKGKGRKCFSGFLRLFEDHILFKEKFCDTIFQTTDFTDITPRYILNNSKNKLTYEDLYTKPSHALVNKNYIESYFETSLYLLVYIHSSTFPNYIWIFDKASNHITIREVSSIEDYNIENDFDTGPEISLFRCFTFGWHQEEYLYSFIEPYALIEALNAEDSPIEKESRMYELAHQVNENDNPILVKIKLKSTNN